MVVLEFDVKLLVAFRFVLSIELSVSVSASVQSVTLFTPPDVAV